MHDVLNPPTQLLRAAVLSHHSALKIMPSKSKLKTHTHVVAPYFLFYRINHASLIVQNWGNATRKDQRQNLASPILCHEVVKAATPAAAAKLHLTVETFLWDAAREATQLSSYFDNFTLLMQVHAGRGGGGKLMKKRLPSFNGNKANMLFIFVKVEPLVNCTRHCSLSNTPLPINAVRRH